MYTLNVNWRSWTISWLLVFSVVLPILNIIFDFLKCCFYINVFSFSSMEFIIIMFSKFRWSFVINGPFASKWALIQILAWHRSGADPLSESMMA